MGVGEKPLAEGRRQRDVGIWWLGTSGDRVIGKARSQDYYASSLNVR